MSKKTLVVVESPLKGSVRRNSAYALAAMRDCIARGEAPLASHVLYALSGVLDDDVETERGTGIECGLAWGRQAELTAVYVDLGISEGMKQGIEAAEKAGRPVDYRRITTWKWPP